MKRLGGVREKSMPLNAVSLDLRSPAGKTTEGYFRLIVNAIADRQGRMRRLGGWRALSLSTPGNRINEDLHDQLITNTATRVLVVAPTSPVNVLAFSVGAGSLGATEVGFPTVSVSGLGAGAGSPIGVPLATVSVTPMSVVNYWNGYQWRTYGKTTRTVNDTNPGYFDLTCVSVQAGGTITVRFYTSVSAGANTEVFVYGFAPLDATLWAPGTTYEGLTLWNPIKQNDSLSAPSNTFLSTSAT